MLGDTIGAGNSSEKESVKGWDWSERPAIFESGEPTWVKGSQANVSTRRRSKSGPLPRTPHERAALAEQTAARERFTFGRGKRRNEVAGPATDPRW